MFERFKARLFNPQVQISHVDQLPAVRNFQSPENPATPLSWPAQWLVDLFGGGVSKSGVAVSNESAMRSSAVYACVTLLAQTMASLPLKVMKVDPQGAQIENPDHPMYYLLHDEPNPNMSSVLWREFLIANLLLGGNAYSVLGRNGAGRVVDMFPLPYHCVTPYRKDGRMKYTVRIQGTSDEETFDQDDMLHVPGYGFDGVQGYSVITNAARESVGLALATEEHGARMFSNGATMGVVLSHPKNLSDPAQKRLAAQFEEHHKGLSNVARAMVVEEGMTVSTVAMTGVDAQFLETRRFQVEDICRFFRVPPHMVGHTDKQTSWGTGVEQNTLGFLMFTLVPLLVRFEQEYNRKLFPRSPYYAQHKTQGLMRGDSKARSEYYAKGFTNGWMSPNEIRKAEDMPPIPGGDRYFVPTNLIPLDQAGKVPADPNAPDPNAPDPNQDPNEDPNAPDPNADPNTPEEQAKRKLRRY